VEGNDALIELADNLSGDPGETVSLVHIGGSYINLPSTSNSTYFLSGTVSDGTAGPSVPEPSSILATVTAVTLGVVLRGKKRKI